MFPFYDFTTGNVHAPVVEYTHMVGYSVPTAGPGRVLAEGMTLSEAARTFGGVTGFNIR